MTAITAYIGLGANLGQPDLACQSAIKRIDAAPGITVVKSSALYRTVPIDAPGPDYCNAVIEITSELSASDLLDLLLAIELEFGRTRAGWNSPRTLDCDLLAMQGVRICETRLILPHPRAHLRAFVLIPLCELNREVQLGPPESDTLESAETWISRLSLSARSQVERW
ncbi:MAG: 2-amino-4-hydroxy-6-hydroxymethyldihydropteridine diphosphokinase [Betaproteobacteria bacterium]|nr:2-amino-4-hydroxy-6-hydroxymethyldihydropteridine diphosphokinase [Betaproteobacteria bacterium]